MDSLRENYKELMKNNELTLESKQRSRHKTHNVFTDIVSKIALSANNDKEHNQSIQHKPIHMGRVKT